MNTTTKDLRGRENRFQKADRLLLERAVKIKVLRGARLLARVRGQGTEYQVGHSPAGGWNCSCEARAQCSHLIAVQSVVDLPRMDKQW